LGRAQTLGQQNHIKMNEGYLKLLNCDNLLCHNRK
jgi:hypothetical protein